MYINMGHEPKRLGLIVQGCTYQNITGRFIWESKGFDGLIFADNTIAGSVSVRQGFRIRHGIRNSIVRNTGLRQINVRGAEHVLAENSGARVILYAGSLPARYEDWKPLHVPGLERNWQCADDCYVEACGSVDVGTWTDGEHKYLATGNKIHPDQDNVRLISGGQRNTIRVAVDWED
jgi:hypothetical protein